MASAVSPAIHEGLGEGGELPSEDRPAAHSSIERSDDCSETEADTTGGALVPGADPSEGVAGSGFEGDRGGGRDAGLGRRWRRNKLNEGAEKEDGVEPRKGIFTYDWERGKRVKWVASKNSRAVVEEGNRKLGDYLALPPTEYSLLDPKMITRLTDDTFKMDCGTLSIVGTKVSPVLFVKVEVRPEQSQANIMVERVEIGGSEAVRNAGGTFNVTSSTVVSSSEMEGHGGGNTRELRTRAEIEIEMLVPNENFVPVGVLRRAGSFVMQRVVDIGLPQFTKFLKRDYARWAKGDDTRSAVASDGESLIDARPDED